MKLNVAVDLKIKAFGGATISDKESGMYNAILTDQGVTQRPSISIQEIASSARGRAIYYWSTNSTLYIVNNNTIYRNSYSTALGTTITAGTKKCKFLQLGSSLVLLNPDGNAGYTITTGHTVTAITGFPSTLTPGGAVLNGYLYVMDEDGTIYNSDLDDPTTITAGNTVNAEREEDGGVYLGKHHDHIVAFGDRTIEFFFDNANPTNSPLDRREGLSHNIGCADGYSVWEDGDLTIFIGNDLNNGIGVYALTNFTLKKISNGNLDSLITKSITVDGYSVQGSGISAQGHKFYLLTFYVVSTNVVAENTFVYDFTTNLWSEWETAVNSVMDFPVIDTTIRSSQALRYTEGIFSNGDIFIVNNDLSPQDSVAASIYVSSGYVVNDYITETASDSSSITMQVRLGQISGDTNNNKFHDNLSILMNQTSSSQTLTVRAADDDNSTFATVGTIDTSDINRDIRQLGAFRRRNIELEYAGSQQIYIEGVETQIRQGSR